MAPEAPRVATRASRAPRSPRGLLAVPWWSLTVLAILVVAATRAAADAEVYQEYARSARDEAAPAAAAPKWPEPDSEDEFVDRISMLMGPSKEGGRDLAAQRLRLSRLREEQEEKERQQQKQQQQQEDSLQKQLQGERASHESPQQQQQQQQVRPRPAQETKASAKAPQQQQRPADDTERQMQLYWQEAARAALAKQQKEAVSKATLARQQEAETKAAQEAAKARQAEAAKAALSKQQEVAAQQEEAKALYAKQQQEEARQAAAAAKAKQEEAVAAAKDEQQLEDLDDAYDIARALTQQPSVPAIDQTLLRTYMRSLGPQVGSVDQVGPIWQRYWDQVLASLSQQGLQQQQQPAVSDLIAELLNDAERQTQQTQQRQREMQWQAQQQQQTQDRQQQMLLQAQHEQMDPSTAQKMLLQQQQTQQQPQQQQQPPFTYTFQKPEQSSRFAINPADPRFWQEDPRLQYLVSRSGGVDGSQPQEDQYDEGSSGVRQALIRSASGLSIPMDLGVSSEQQPDQPDDMVDVDEDLGAVGDDMWLPQQRQQQRQQQGSRVTPPVVPEGIRHQPKPTATRDSRLDEESGRGSNLSNHDYPVVKKQLTFPKDHWFFGMDDVGKLAIFIGASIAVSSMILGFIVWQYRLHRNAKAAADVEYPAYGVTGPNKDVSPTGDRRLAQSAQMYHYQHQKQQILAMESRAAGGRRGSMSEAESEDENEEGDYTVYECPGLAPTQEMEVKNPLFQDDPTPATPAPGVGAEAGHDGDGLPEGGKQQQQQAGKTKQDKHSNNGKTTRSKPSDKSDRP